MARTINVKMFNHIEKIYHENELKIDVLSSVEKKNHMNEKIIERKINVQDFNDILNINLYIKYYNR